MTIIDGVRARHANARQDWEHNPAAKNCHHDLGFALEWITFLDGVIRDDNKEIAELKAELASEREHCDNLKLAFDLSEVEIEKLETEIASRTSQPLE